MRALSVSNLLEKKYKTFELDGVYRMAMGTPERNGAWIIFGKEKNGKTWYALLLAALLSKFEKVLYVSAEEGTGMNFQDSVKRAKLDPKKDDVKFIEYVPFDDLRGKLKSRKAAKVVFVDNCTAYADELNPSAFRKMVNEYSNTLFIFLAHEEKNEPSTALAKAVKKWAKVIFRIEGLTAHISGRVPGGIVSIDENKAMLYWGVPVEPQLKAV